MAANDREVRKLLQTTELWFMPVANPDGYQYTFDHERLWRKNLRDNNGDGQITVGDGVDPNRNFPNHWGYDNEGSSPIHVQRDLPRPGADVGAGDPGDGRPARPDQVRRSRSTTTPTASGCSTPRAGRSAPPPRTTRSTTRMSGNLDEPAIEGFHPGLSSDVLYVTNGETTDYAHATTAPWPGRRS